MLFFFLIGATIIFLILGIIYIVRGFNTQTAPSVKVVPISDIKEIKALNTTEVPQPISSTPILSTPPTAEISLTQHLLNQNLKPAVSNNFSESKSEAVNVIASEVVQKESSKEPDKSLDVVLDSETAQRIAFQKKLTEELAKAQNQIHYLMSDNHKLKEALEREVSSKSVALLSDEAQQEMERMKKELAEAKVNLMSTTNNDISTKKEVNDLERRIGQLVFEATGLQNEKKALEASLAQKAAQLAAIESESVLVKSKEGRQKEESEKQLEQLQIEKQNILDQLKKSGEKIAGLEKNLEYSLKVSEQDLKQAQDTIKSLEVKVSKLTQEKDEAFNSHYKELMATLESLKSEREILLQTTHEAQTNLAKVKEYNDHLLKKEQLLQYELSKSRAQSIGLEKICEDFKEQIEELSKIKVN